MDVLSCAYLLITTLYIKTLGRISCQFCSKDVAAITGMRLSMHYTFCSTRMHVLILLYRNASFRMKE